MFPSMKWLEPNPEDYDDMGGFVSCREFAESQAEQLLNVVKGSQLLDDAWTRGFAVYGSPAYREADLIEWEQSLFM